MDDLHPGERLLLDGGGWVLRDLATDRYVLVGRNGEPRADLGTLGEALQAAGEREH